MQLLRAIIDKSERRLIARRACEQVRIIARSASFSGVVAAVFEITARIGSI